jgi:hypothetical protein
MNIEIKSVKIKDSKPLVIYFPLDDNGEHQAELTYDKGPKCHEDFEKKMDNLKVHFTLLTGYLKPGPIKNIEKVIEDEIVKSFSVGGFHIGGKDEDQGIVIVGHRILPNGKAQILNSPFYRFNEDDATRYKFMDDLQLALEDCKDEAVKYISGEKVWKDPQLALELKTEDSQEAV